MGNLIFNNVSSEDLGIRIATAPTYTCPKKNVSATQLLGRDGDVIVDYGTYNNVSRSYVMSLPIEYGEYSYYASKISGWLNGPSGYSRLEDSYEPEYYRMARLDNELSFTNVHDGAIAFEAEFDCKPQRFLKIGEHYKTVCEANPSSSYSFTINNKIKNPTAFAARPLYKITTYTENTDYSITFRHGSKESYNMQLTIKNSTSHNTARNIYFDTDSYSCYEIVKDDSDNITINNLNANVEFSTYILNGDGSIKGNEQVDITSVSNVTKVEVMPRWWTL